MYGNTCLTSRTTPKGTIHYDSVAAEWTHYFNPVNWVIVVPKGTYTNLADAQSSLKGTEIVYQLATPIKSKLNLTPLSCYKNGTVIVESTLIPTITYAVPINQTGQVNSNIMAIEQQSEIMRNILENMGQSNPQKMHVGPFKVSCEPNETFKLVVSSANSKDFSRKTFTVVYDPNEVEVYDLCGLTSQIETSPCNVNNIVFTKVENGLIEFYIDRPIENTTMWQGTINVIEFKAKSGCDEATISYTVE